VLIPQLYPYLILRGDQEEDGTGESASFNERAVVKELTAAIHNLKQARGSPAFA